MKLECKLGKYGFARNGKGTKDVYTFIPLKKPYDKYVRLVISGDLAKETLETMSLPGNFGDVIEVDFSPKQTQGRLPTRMDEDVKDKGTGKKARTGYRQA